MGERQTSEFPPHRVLQLPELLRLVFNNINQPGELALCARVCRQWFELASRRLWRGSEYPSSFKWKTPSIKTLARIARLPPEDRLAIYLSTTESFHAWDETIHTPSFLRHHLTPLEKEETWALLETHVLKSIMAPEVTIALTCGNLMLQRLSRQILNHYVLRLDLQLIDHEIGDEFLDFLATTCPRLEQLYMPKSGGRCTHRGARRMLRRLTQLRRMSLPLEVFTPKTRLPSAEHPMGVQNSIWSEILRCFNLELLSDHDDRRHDIHMDYIERASKGGKYALIPMCICMKLSMTNADILPDLIKSPYVLQSVDLRFRRNQIDTTTKIFNPISTCFAMRNITLKFDADADIKMTDLMLIAKGCKQLKCFSLRVTTDFGHEAEEPPDLDDDMSPITSTEDEIIALASLCPNLQEFTFDVPLCIIKSPFLTTLISSYDAIDIMALQQGQFRIPFESMQTLEKGLEILPALRAFNQNLSYSHGELIAGICDEISEVCESRGLPRDPRDVEEKLRLRYQGRKKLVLEEIYAIRHEQATTLTLRTL